MEKMTLHRALAELKLIDSRITKGISEIKGTNIYQLGKKIGGIDTVEEFNKKAKSKYDSVTALIDRKVNIKSAIVKANAKTTITIGNKTMTIAEAINYKTVVALKTQLSQNLGHNYNNAVNQLTANNIEVENAAERLASAALGKDNVKLQKDDVENITKPYVKSHEFHLANPLDVVNLTDKLETEIQEFQTEIDATLSEINAITIIEI